MDVLLSAAMSLDGKIATKGGDAKFSSFKDLKELHKLRASADAILVGIGTILNDNPRLTVRYAKGKNPIRVIIDSRARIPLNANALQPTCPKIIIAVSEHASKSRVERLESSGMTVITCGNKKIDLKKLFQKLKKFRIKKVLLEGGSILNWSMLNEGFVNRLRITVSPVIVAGKNSKGLVEGPGFSRIASGIKLKLLKCQKFSNEAVLSYKVIS